MKTALPGCAWRIFSVFLRHKKCYTKHLFANGFPPFIEPLLFLAAIGFGLGKYVDTINGVPYSQYIAPGLLASTAMYTSTFELTYAAYIRMEFEKIYDAILSTPIGIKDAFLGEILWAGAKGFFFSSAVLIVITLFGLVKSPFGLLAPFVGFLTGVSFGSMALVVTSYVKDINNFNFYITGCCTPMFFLSGIIIPLDQLPEGLRVLSFFIPLTHCVNLMRELILGSFHMSGIIDLVWLLLFIPVAVSCAIYRIRKRLIV
ncbi:MAG: ABC transporter permease [Candidatus Auribacterota bacterium]